MGVWLVDVDVLARSRFRISPLAETVATLAVLHGQPNRPGQLPRPTSLRAAFRRRVAADPVAAAFLAGALLPFWVADFLCTPPDRDGMTFEQELRRISTAPAAALRADLADGDPVLDGTDLPARIADLLRWVWSAAVEPDWQRRRRAFEADVVARTRRLSTGGWANAINDLRPNLRWLGDGRLQINTREYPPRDLTGAELVFIPTTGGGWSGWDRPHRYSLVYPCTALLAQDPAPAPDSLRRLIGTTRATLLYLLDGPMSPTHLVAVTGFTLGAVGNHLKLLMQAGLISRRRAGRSVLYYRTELGELMTAGSNGTGGRSGRKPPNRM
uniref:ArsR/SmtB family transcription factor n=1 Tax=Paractinoplanes polyasparticus TaxID=2856853 RepID=UPI001C8503D9|nr:winged helix-turn-helix domain-containing protein [Actinoplanes polyasparticus]